MADEQLPRQRPVPLPGAGVQHAGRLTAAEPPEGHPGLTEFGRKDVEHPGDGSPVVGRGLHQRQAPEEFHHTQALCL